MAPTENDLQSRSTLPEEERGFDEAVVVGPLQARQVVEETSGTTRVISPGRALHRQKLYSGARHSRLMDPSEFAQLAALAALAEPGDPEERDTYEWASRMLGEFAGEVERGAGGSALGTAPPCPLRADETRAGLPDGAVLDAAPETGERLILVPRIL